MTRFMMPIEQGVELVWEALSDMVGGEIYVAKVASMKITEIAEAVGPKSKQIVVGVRPGEKLHEQMIGQEDSPFTFEYPDYYKILPAIYNWHKEQSRIKDGIKVREEFSYTTNKNSNWMTKKQLMKWVEQNRDQMGC